MPIANDTTQQLIDAQILDISRPNSEIYDVVAKMRSAAADPSPLTRIMADPAIVELARLKKQGKAGAKGSKKVPSIRRLAIQEEEHELSRLKALLRRAADYLERAAQQTGESEAITRHAEKQEKEATAKLSEAEIARSRLEMELQASVADLQQFQLELQSAEHNLKRLEVDLRQAEWLKDEFEKAAVKAEDRCRQYKIRLLDYKIRESKREHVHRIDLLNTLDEGRDEGWVEGEKNGFKEGIFRGYLEGRKAGRIEGAEGKKN